MFFLVCLFLTLLNTSDNLSDAIAHLCAKCSPLLSFLAKHGKPNSSGCLPNSRLPVPIFRNGWRGASGARYSAP